MKRNENKSNRNRSLVVLLVLCAMLAVTLVGCKKPAAENPVPSTPTSEVESEVVSEEVSEPVSEEPSEEVVSEEVSEPEIVDGVQMIYYETYADMNKTLENLDKSAVVAYSFYTPEKGQAIMYDGAHYTIEKDFATIVRCPNTIKKVTSTEEYVHILDYDYEGVHEWAITIYTTGTDIEVPLTITYEDGTEETLTVYITKDWDYSWAE